MPLSKKLNEQAEALQKDICRFYRTELDVTGNIGKRYRRQDEIGTPFCLTYDFESANDNSVTVRDRDTMAQEPGQRQPAPPVSRQQDLRLVNHTDRHKKGKAFQNRALSLFISIGFNIPAFQVGCTIRFRAFDIVPVFPISRMLCIGAVHLWSFHSRAASESQRKITRTEYRNPNHQRYIDNGRRRAVWCARKRISDSLFPEP